MKRIFLVLLFLPLCCCAGTVDDLKQFLSGTRTLRGEFSQRVISRSGRKPQQSSGVVSLARPGRLRWEIRKPFPQLMVGDGQRFWIYDQELAQVTVKKAGQALGSTPAALLSGNNDIERSFTLRELPAADGLAWVEAIPKNADSGFEKLHLGLQDKTLKAMELYDSFGQITHLHFSGLERNVPLSDDLFVFVPPSGVDVVGE